MSATISLDSDLYSEQFEDNFEKVQQNCDSIRSICQGKNKLSPFILLGYIWVELCSWGCEGTYQQTRPIPTTPKMLYQLLKEKKIDMKEVARILKEEYLLSDTVSEETIKELSQDNMTLTTFKKAYDLLKKGECPFLEKILFAAELQSSRDERKHKGNYCVYELKIIGAFKKINDNEEKEALKNFGIISEEVLNDAMTTINEVVKKKLKPETLRKARFLDSDSKTIHGYEVFKLLQKPCDNELRNVLHVNRSLMNEEREGKSPLTHWKNLSLRSNAYERIMNTVNLTYLTFCQVLRIALLITSMDADNVTENSIVNDIYKLDPKTANIDDIETILKRHDTNDNENATKEKASTPDIEGVSMLSVQLYEDVWHGMTAGASRVKCFACNGSHYLSKCKNEEAKQKLKRNQPDVYEKFITRSGPKLNRIPCRFKDDCRKHKEGKCPFKHDSPASGQKAEKGNNSQTSDDFGMMINLGNDPMVFHSPTQADDDFSCMLGTTNTQDRLCKPDVSIDDFSSPYRTAPNTGSDNLLTKHITKTMIEIALMMFASILYHVAESWYMELCSEIIMITVIYKASKDQCKREWKKGPSQTNHTALPVIAYGSNTTVGRKILDSGANIHMTGDAASLHNKENIHLFVQTANGRIQCNQKGDTDLILGSLKGDERTFKLKDVVHNPKLDGDLVSVYQVCKNSATPTCVIFSQHGAWTCPAKVLHPHIDEFKSIARATTKGAYICTTPDIIDRIKKEGCDTDAACTMVGSSDVVQQNDALKWHQRLGHLGITALKQMKNNRWIPSDISRQCMNTFEQNSCLCKGCLLGAQKNHKHPAKTPTARNSMRPTEPGAEIHGDLFTIPKECGYTTCALFIDSATSNKFTYFLNSKKETDLAPVIEHLFRTIKSDGFTPRKLFFDGEKAITGSLITRTLANHGVQHVLTADSQQNLAEATIPKLRRMANHMLHDRNMGEEYYRDAIRYASQIMSIIPHTRLGGRCPYQEYYKKQPHDLVKRVRTFGSICYYHKKVVTTKKHDPTTELIFLGFESINGPYRAINPKTQGKNHIYSWHAIFDESYKRNDWLEKIKIDRLLPLPQFVPEVHGQTLPDPTDEIDGPPTPTVQSTTPPVSEQKTQETGPLRRSTRQRVPTRMMDMGPGKTYGTTQPLPDGKPLEPISSADPIVPIPITEDTGLTAQGFLSEAVSFISKTVATLKPRHPTLLQDAYPKGHNIPVPKSLKEAQNSSYWPEFEVAMRIETKTLQEHNTFKIEPKRPRTHKLGTKWVYDVKTNKEGDVVRFKARLVAKGFTQIPGREYGQTFAPVCTTLTILFLFALTVTLTLTIKLLDFKGAFLHSLMPPDMPVYIHPPYGLDVHPSEMVRLHKSLYGTKNAGHLWWKDLEAELLALGFLQSPHDKCLFYRSTQSGTTTSTTWLCTWVDDIIVATNDPHIDVLITTLKRHHFDIQTFEDLDWYLGIKVDLDTNKGILHLSQEAYIDALLNQFNMTDCHPVDTPMVTSPPTDEHCSPVDAPLDKPYRQLLGSLSHIARFTRPDILFSVFYLARYQQQPGEAHWRALKRILRYLKGTKSLTLNFRRGSSPHLALDMAGCSNTADDLHRYFRLGAYADSDWGGCKDTRKSTTGYAILFNNCPLLCRSSKQKSTATSVCASETIALADCVQDLLWARNLVHDALGIIPRQKQATKNSQPPESTVYCDNQSTIDIVNSDKGSRRVKHIAIKHGFLQDEQGTTVNIQKIPTKDNLADIFTKPLPRAQFCSLRDRLFGLEPNPYSIINTALLSSVF